MANMLAAPRSQQSSAPAAPYSAKRSNPLQRPTTADHPAYDHARMFKQIGKLPLDGLEKRIDKVDYILPEIGRLASDPNVTRTKVTKAVADAIGKQEDDNQVITPDEGIRILASMPDNDQQLRGWLRNLYAQHLSGAVHLKAAAIIRDRLQQAQQMPPGGMPPQPQGMPAGPMQQPGQQMGAPQ